MAEAEPAADPERSQASAEVRGNRPLVLVVEDDDGEWRMYGKILWYNGFDVAYAPDGETGLELARERRPDLVLLDLMLPGIGGLGVCRRMKRDPRTAGVPVIVLTGRPRREAEPLARDAGCSLFMEKPASPSRVLHAVEELVGRPPASGELPPPQLLDGRDGTVTA